MEKQIFSAYYHSETGGVGITFVYTTDIETAEEYLDRIFGESLISVQKYVRPERKKNLKKE